MALLSTASSIKSKWEAVNAAIDKILAGGQSASIEGKSVNRADLSRLIQWRDDLEEQYARLTGNGGATTNLADFR